MRSLHLMHIVLLGMVMCLSASRTSAADKVVKVATLEWRPFCSTNMVDGGPATQIVTEAFKRVGRQADVHFMPWTEVMARSDAGAFSAIYPAYFSSERMKRYYVSEPFLCSPVVLVARAGTPVRFDSLESLKPYRIGTVAGYANSEAFDNADYLTRIEAKTDLDNLQALKEHRVDLIAIDRVVAEFLLAQNGDILGPRAAYVVLHPPLGNRDMYVMFPKSLHRRSRKLLKAFNKGLRELKDEGLIGHILKHHGFQ